MKYFMKITRNLSGNNVKLITQLRETEPIYFPLSVAAIRFRSVERFPHLEVVG